MSTKTTRVYVSTEPFTLHLYDDFAGSTSLFIRVGSAETKISLSKEEADEIEKQFKE